MLSGRKKILFFLTGVLLFTGIFLFANSSQAALFTIRGKAYWQQYGYIYFHCMDAVIGNRFDQPENLRGADLYLPPAEELFHFYSVPCTDLVFSVELDEQGLFSGRAWNPSVGFINFYGSSAPNYSFNSSNCPQCTSANNCIACYDFDNQRVYGWAYIPSTNEYIRLNDDFWDLGTSDLVRIHTDADNPLYPSISGIELGDFVGTASMHTGTKPRISFNCLTENYPGADTCGVRPYKVFIKNLVIDRLSAPNWTYTNACSSGALRAVLRWEKLSGIQSAFEVVVNDSPSFSTSTNDYVCWSGKKNSPETFQYVISNSNPDCGGRLQYGTPYYWWVRGYDETDMATDWVQYRTNSVTDTDQNLDANQFTFQTFKHEFPNPFFSWSPLDIYTSTTTTFTSDSLVYENANPTLAVSCEPGRCNYLWETDDLGAVIHNPNSYETGINFFTATNTSVTLTVTDFEGYYCSASSMLRINYDLPIWREVKAQ